LFKLSIPTIFAFLLDLVRKFVKLNPMNPQQPVIKIFTGKNIYQLIKFSIFI